MIRTASLPLRSRFLVPSLLLGGLLLACCAAAPPGAPTLGESGQEPVDQAADQAAEQAPEAASEEGANSEPQPRAAGSEPFDCAALDELGCLDSAECTLRQREDKTYVCTPATSDCERGFLQSAGRREDCPADCGYSPAQCYCSPDVTCVCGGGPPALCLAAD